MLKNSSYSAELETIPSLNRRSAAPVSPRLAPPGVAWDAVFAACTAGDLSFTSEDQVDDQVAQCFRSSICEAVTSFPPSLIIHLTFLQEEPAGTFPFSQTSPEIL